MCKECTEALRAAGGDVSLVPVVARLRALETSAEQGSLLWLDERRRVMTASEFHGIVGGVSHKSAMRKKLRLSRFAGNVYTRHGHQYEPEACARYERETGHVVAHFGLWVNREAPHFGRAPVGGSPDGVTLCGRLLEIKCPYTRAITGVVPAGYVTQMQLLMLVAGLRACDYVEYKPPALVGGAGEFAIVALARDAAWWGGVVLERAAAFWAAYSELRVDDAKCAAYAEATRPGRCLFDMTCASVLAEQAYAN